MTVASLLTVLALTGFRGRGPARSSFISVKPGELDHLVGQEIELHGVAGTRRYLVVSVEGGQAELMDVQLADRRTKEGLRRAPQTAWPAHYAGHRALGRADLGSPYLTQRSSRPLPPQPSWLAEGFRAVGETCGSPGATEGPVLAVDSVRPLSIKVEP